MENLFKGMAMEGPTCLQKKKKRGLIRGGAGEAPT